MVVHNKIWIDKQIFGFFLYKLYVCELQTIIYMINHHAALPRHLSLHRFRTCPKCNSSERSFPLEQLSAAKIFFYVASSNNNALLQSPRGCNYCHKIRASLSSVLISIQQVALAMDLKPKHLKNCEFCPGSQFIVRTQVDCQWYLGS